MTQLKGFIKYENKMVPVSSGGNISSVHKSSVQKFYVADWLFIDTTNTYELRLPYSQSGIASIYEKQESGAYSVRRLDYDIKDDAVVIYNTTPFDGYAILGGEILIDADENGNSIGATYVNKVDLEKYSGLPIGFEKLTTNPEQEDDWLPMDGRTLSRTEYADLWHWVQNQGDYLKTETEWLSADLAHPTGDILFYSNGNSETTFRIPRVSHNASGIWKVKVKGSVTVSNSEDLVNTVKNKVDKVQSPADAGKVLAIGTDGTVEPQMLSGLPLGFEYFSMNPNIPFGSLPLLGGTYSKEIYKDLWNWAKSQPGYVISEEEWLLKWSEQKNNVPFYADAITVTPLTQHDFTWRKLIAHYDDIAVPTEDSVVRFTASIETPLNIKAKSKITYMADGTTGVDVALLVNGTIVSSNEEQYTFPADIELESLAIQFTLQNIYGNLSVLQAAFSITDEQLNSGSITEFLQFTINKHDDSRFRVPALSCWVRGATGISEVGSYLAAGLPNITGTDSGFKVTTASATTEPTATGAIRIDQSEYAAYIGTAYNTYRYSTSFDASRSNNIYGKSVTVQPDSVVGLWLVKAFGVVDTNGRVDLNDLVDTVEKLSDYVDVFEEEGITKSNLAENVANVNAGGASRIVCVTGNSTINSANDCNDAKIDKIVIYGKSVQDGFPYVDRVANVSNVLDNGILHIKCVDATNTANFDERVLNKVPALRSLLNGTYADKLIIDCLEGHVQHVSNIVVLTPEELGDAVWHTVSTENDYIYVYTDRFDGIIKAGQKLYYSTHLESINELLTVNNALGNYVGGYQSEVNKLRISLSKDLASTVVAVPNWLKENGVYVYAVRKTPLVTTFDAEDIVDILKLNVVGKSVQFMNNVNAVQQVTYSVNLRDYILARIAEAVTGGAGITYGTKGDIDTIINS